MEPKTTDLTPRGLQTPEGVARVNKAVEAVEHLNAQIYVATAELWARCAHDSAFEEAMRACFCDKEEADDVLEHITAVLRARQLAQDEFMNAIVTGQEKHERDRPQNPSSAG